MSKKSIRQQASPVVLVSFFDWNAAMGLRQLYAALRANHIPVRVVQLGLSKQTENLEEQLLLQCLEYDTPTYMLSPSDHDFEDLGAYLADESPCLVGMSVLSTDYQVALRAVRAVRDSCDAPIVWGGIHPTFAPEESLRASGVDAVVVGEGEDALVELACMAREGECDFASVSNVAWLDEVGEYHCNSVRPLIKDLDSWPFVPFADEDVRHIPNNQYEQARQNALSEDRDFSAAASIMTGLGCPYKCTFCFNEPMIELYRGKGKYVRRKSVGRTIEECLHARDGWNKQFIAFWDDIFSLDRKWLEEFAARYPKEVGLPYFCYFHPKHTDDAFIDLIVSSGCSSAICGVQSGSEELRSSVYHRFETNKDIIRAAQKLNTRIDMTYDMIIDCPYETEEHWRSNVELFLEFPHPFKITTNSIIYLPGCSITQRALADGLIDESMLAWQREDYDQCNNFQARRTPLQHNFYVLLNAVQHPEFSREEIRTWMDDRELMSHPERLRLVVALKLLEKTRRLYFQQSDKSRRMERQLLAPDCEKRSKQSISIAPKGVVCRA